LKGEIKMKKEKIIVTILFILMAATPALSADKHGSHVEGTDTQTSGSFTHKAMIDGMHAEFQIMSLASMNMKDQNGATHHIILKLSKAGADEPIQQVVGKIKVIDPNGNEQIATLKDYNGILAANFAFKEPGKYGVICLFKENEKKHVTKFWYPHE
jgi:hypothetical protein